MGVSRLVVGYPTSSPVAVSHDHPMNTDTSNTIAFVVLALVGASWIPVLASWLYYLRRDSRSVEQVD